MLYLNCTAFSQLELSIFFFCKLRALLKKLTFIIFFTNLLLFMCCSKKSNQITQPNILFISCFQRIESSGLIDGQVPYKFCWQWEQYFCSPRLTISMKNHYLMEATKAGCICWWESSSLSVSNFPAKFNSLIWIIRPCYTV